MPTADIADDVDNLGNAGTLAPLIDDREVRVEPLGELAGADHAADVRGDDHDRQVAVAGLDVPAEQRRRVEIVHGNVEEALDLHGVQIQGQNPVDTGDREQLGHQLGGNRGAGTGLPVLTRI